MNNKTIVALDFSTREDVFNFLAKFDEPIYVKIGMELTYAFGLDIVREIRKILKECIDGEDKKKPLTDDELADILKEKGYPIARRTVAKYRQQLNIPVARLRK